MKWTFGFILIGQVLVLTLISSCFFTENCVAAQKADASPISSNLFHKLPSIIDWMSYMKIYNKTYSSFMQQMIRQKIFLTRAMHVFITSVKYRFYHLSYYTTINKYSDWTPAETYRILSADSNKILEKLDIDGNDDEGLIDDNEATKILTEAIAVEQSLNKDSVELVVSNERADALKNLHRSRRKRSINSDNNARNLNFEDLVRIPSSTDIKSINNLNIKWQVPSNNPNYRDIKLRKIKESNDHRNVHDIPPEQIETIEKAMESDKNNNQNVPILDRINSIKNSVFNLLNPQTKTTHEEDIKTAESDQHEDSTKITVLRDWRQSGCISPPIDQGYCASCYAISSMSYVEWAFCSSQDNVLTPLSAQYMVSCGLQYTQETEGEIYLGGCDYGLLKQTMYFVKEYGVELELNMPYEALETPCPVASNSPLKTKGYIRPNIKPPVRLRGTTKKFDLALKKGPVIVSLWNPKEFMSYGGGMIESCEQEGGHAALIVGSMIENEVEYLLIKNSFGQDWGYNGYFKLKRSAVPECVKEFVAPIISFPSLKSQNRHIKAYQARQQSQSSSVVDEEIDINSDYLFSR